MKHNELVWRTLIDSSATGKRSWDSIADLAHAAGTPWATTRLACQKLTDIGAITKYKGGGFSVVNPGKVLTVASGARNLEADTLAWTTAEALHTITGGAHALGGPDAAIHHLGGTNTVAGFSQRIVYVPKHAEIPPHLPDGDHVRVLRMDARAELDWDGVSSIAQTLVDLFATPGWQASEFRIALHDKYFAGRDWDQKETHNA